MTDRELLEMAAKAAGVFMRKEDWPYTNPFDPECLQTFFDPDGLSITGTRLWYGSDGDIGGTEQYTWNPLTDDGDALRLAVRLHIDILHRFIGGQRVEVLAPGGPLISQSCDEQSRQDATRRAIVRAAAEIGKSMEQGKNG